MRPRLEHAANTLLTLAVLLTGCASNQSADPLPAPALSSTEIPADPAAALPLSAYRHDLDARRAIAEAHATLVAACMAGLGHPDWIPPELPDERPWESGMSIGLLDPAHAAAHGYRAPSDTRRAEDERAPEDERLAHLGPFPGEQAPEGVPDGGCAGEADRALGPPADLTAVGELSLAAEEAVAADPRAVEALSAWSACMAARGHEYGRPAEAQFQYWPRTVTDVERALASADVACKQETGLAGVWFGLLGGYQRELIERSRERLDTVAQALAAELTRAREVLS